MEEASQEIPDALSNMVNGSSLPSSFGNPRKRGYDNGRGRFDNGAKRGRFENGDSRGNSRGSSRGGGGFRGGNRGGSGKSSWGAGGASNGRW